MISNLIRGNVLLADAAPPPELLIIGGLAVLIAGLFLTGSLVLVGLLLIRWLRRRQSYCEEHRHSRQTTE